MDFQGTVALLGTGLLGAALAERLLERKQPLVVYNRTPEKLSALKNLGAESFETPQEAIRRASVIILMLSDSRAIEEVLFPDGFKNFSGKTFIQMGTIAPAESQRLLSRIQSLNGEYFECPVLGSIPEARSGNLILMAGASEEQFLRWRDFLSCFGPRPRRVGAVGQAAAMKLALNQLIAALVCSFSVSLGIVEKRSIDVQQFMDVLRESALYAKMFDKKLPRMLKRNFVQPNFPVKHLLKDVLLILDEIDKNQISPLQTAGVKGIIEEALQEGLAEQDYSAVFNVICPRTDSGDRP